MALAARLCDVPFLAPSNSPGELVRDPALGRLVLYQSMFAEKSPPALVRIDFERGIAGSFPQPDGRGSWRVRLLSDGYLWFGMNGPGQLACFDPATDRFLDVPRYSPSSQTSHLTDVVEGSDGRLYMPSYPAGMLVAYDRGSGDFEEFPVAQSNQQLFAACVTDSGLIGVLNGLQHEVYAVDPRSVEVLHRSPSELAGRPDAYSAFLRYGEQFLTTVGAPGGGLEIARFSAADLTYQGSFTLWPPVDSGRHLFTSHAGQLYLAVDDGHILAVDVERGRCEPAFRIEVPSRGIYYFLDDRRILFAGHSPYYGVYDTVKRELDLTRAEIDNPPIGVFSILAAGDGSAYCSSHLGVCLTRVEPETGAGDALGLAHNGSGEIYGSAEAGGRIYSVSYTHAILTVYDPRRPWRPGSGAGANPRNLGSLGRQQYRPVTGIVADGFIEPTAGNARLLVFDLECGVVVDAHEVEGAASIITMGCAGDEVFFWTCDHGGGHRLFALVIAESRLRELPGDGVGDVVNRPMVRGPHGSLYFCADRRIVSVDPAEGSVTARWPADGSRLPEVAYLAPCPRGILFSQGHELWQLNTPSAGGETG